MVHIRPLQSFLKGQQPTPFPYKLITPFIAVYAITLVYISGIRMPDFTVWHSWKTTLNRLYDYNFVLSY